jgi:hypothetical protein
MVAAAAEKRIHGNATILKTLSRVNILLFLCYVIQYILDFHLKPFIHVMAFCCNCTQWQDVTEREICTQ